MRETEIFHYIGTEAGWARCGRNLGHVDQGGEVGGEMPPRTWDVFHVAQSAVRVLGLVEERPGDVCWDCAQRARAALIGPTGDPSVPLYLPEWARDEQTFMEKIAAGWPDPLNEAAMSEDEWAMRRPSGWDGGGRTVEVER